MPKWGGLGEARASDKAFVASKGWSQAKARPGIRGYVLRNANGYFMYIFLNSLLEKHYLRKIQNEHKEILALRFLYLGG